MKQETKYLIIEFLKNIKRFIDKIPSRVKIVTICLLIILILFSIIIPISIKEAEKQKSVIYTGNNLDAKKYPGYKELLDDLLKKHPNWSFTLFYTKLKWDDVIKEEGHSDTRTSPLNLIPDSNQYPENWECQLDNGKKYDNGTWVCASDIAIKHQMDIRNLLNEDNIFQLKEINYTSDDCYTVEAIMEKTKNSFLEGENTANALIKAGKQNNLDPYFIVSRLLQEQGKKGTVLSRGYEYNDTTIYNPFNIAASGNSQSTIIKNAAEYAYSQNWDSLEKGLLGGISFINTKYVEKGQNTEYFQKFDVIKDGNLYTNQYMQNLLAPDSESNMILEQYRYSNTVDNTINFIIPLYENLPVEISE